LIDWLNSCAIGAANTGAPSHGCKANYLWIKIHKMF